MQDSEFETKKKSRHSAVLELLNVRPLDMPAIYEHIDEMENAHKKGDHPECLMMTLYRLIENPDEPQKDEIRNIMSSLQYLSGVDWEHKDGVDLWCDIVSDEFLRKHAKGIIANTPESGARKVYDALKDHEHPRVVGRALSMASDFFDVDALPKLFTEGSLSQQKRAFKVLTEPGLDAVLQHGYSLSELRSAQGLDLSSFGIDNQQSSCCYLSLEMLHFSESVNPILSPKVPSDGVHLQTPDASFDFEQSAVLLARYIKDPEHPCHEIAAKHNAKENAKLAHDLLSELRSCAPKP